MSEPLSPTPDEPDVVDEIELISDGDGLAVIGHAAAVERFLVSEGLQSRELGLPRLRDVLAGGAGVAQAAAAIASASGRWVQLTDESVSAINKWGLMKSNQTGLSMGVVYSKGDPEGIKKIVQFVSDPGTVASRALNPLVLSNAAALMAQVAMQQAIDGRHALTHGGNACANASGYCAWLVVLRIVGPGGRPPRVGGEATILPDPTARDGHRHAKDTTHLTKGPLGLSTVAWTAGGRGSVGDEIGRLKPRFNPVRHGVGE